MKVLFKSINLIGDALNISPALRAWIKQQTEQVEIYFWTLNDHVASLYQGMVRDLLIDTMDDEPRHLKTWVTCFERPNLKFDFEHTFDVNQAFKISHQKKQHVAQSYADLLNVKIDTLKPIYIPDEIKPGYSFDEPWYIEQEGLNGCILISMFSASCTSRDPNYHGVPNKMLPVEKWLPMLSYLRENFPNTSIKALGAPTDVLYETLKDVYKIEPMFGIPLNRLALIMRKAILLVTIDNGMAHLGATQEVHTFEMYPSCLGTHYILPVGNPNLQFVHINPVTVKPEYLLRALQYSVTKFLRRK